MDIVTLLLEPEMLQRRATYGAATRPQLPYRLRFPKSLVDRAAHHLYRNGQEGLEQLVLWGGYPTPDGVVISSLLMPETEATWGWVHVLPPEQPQIALWLRERGQLLFAETHTHGDGLWATEMSDEDRRHPASRVDGFFTLIIPGYARDGIKFQQAGCWECRNLVWHKLPPIEVQQRFSIVSDQEARDALH